MVKDITYVIAESGDRSRFEDMLDCANVFIVKIFVEWKVKWVEFAT